MQYIDQQLRDNHYPNCTKIARYFEVSSKSIQRDIDYMRDLLHAPISYDRKRRGYFYEVEGWSYLAAAKLEMREAEALMATRKVLQQYRGTPYYEEVSRALDKVRQFLPENSPAEELLSPYSIEKPTHRAVDPRMFASIEDAIRRRLKISVTYRATYRASSGETVTERTVRPYVFHYSQTRDTWYMIGYCELRRDVRTFALNRIRTLSVTEHHFTLPGSFSVDEYLEKTFDLIHASEPVGVTIRFTPFQAQWIRERSWHPTQELLELGDGSLVLKMKAGTLDAVKRWLMGFGDEAEALEPQELREMMQDELTRARNMYEDVRAKGRESLPLF
jgi:proteasome accessory factor B